MESITLGKTLFVTFKLPLILGENQCWRSTFVSFEELKIDSGSKSLLSVFINLHVTSLVCSCEYFHLLAPPEPLAVLSYFLIAKVHCVILNCPLITSVDSIGSPKLSFSPLGRCGTRSLNAQRRNGQKPACGSTVLPVYCHRLGRIWAHTGEGKNTVKKYRHALI